MKNQVAFGIYYLQKRRIDFYFVVFGFIPFRHFLNND